MDANSLLRSQEAGNRGGRQDSRADHGTQWVIATDSNTCLIVGQREPTSVKDNMLTHDESPDNENRNDIDGVGLAGYCLRECRGDDDAQLDTIWLGEFRKRTAGQGRDTYTSVYDQQYLPTNRIATARTSSPRRMPP